MSQMLNIILQPDTGSKILKGNFGIIILDYSFYDLESEPCLTQIIKVFNGCEVRIQNSITRLTVQHHELCQVMPNSKLERRNFQFALNNHYRFFFLHTLPSTTACRLEYVISSISRKHNYIFEQEMFSSAPNLRSWRQKVWRKKT